METDEIKGKYRGVVLKVRIVPRITRKWDILEYVYYHPDSYCAEIARGTNSNETTVRKWLRYWMDAGFIRCTGHFTTHNKVKCWLYSTSKDVTPEYMEMGKHERSTVHD